MAMGDVNLLRDRTSCTPDTDVEVVYASARGFARADLSPIDFSLYLPVPEVASPEKLVALGWMSTPLKETFARTIEKHLESGRTGADSDSPEFGVDRDDEDTLIEQLTPKP